METRICGTLCALMRLLQAQWITLKDFRLESEGFVFTFFVKISLVATGGMFLREAQMGMKKSVKRLL